MILLLRSKQRLHSRWSAAEIYFFTGLNPIGFCDDVVTHTILGLGEVSSEETISGEKMDKYLDRYKPYIPPPIIK
jgi:hypothetical protein